MESATNKKLTFLPKLLKGCLPEYVTSGSTCDVYRVMLRGKPYALKVIACGTDPERYAEVRREIQIHQRLSGKNVVRLVQCELVDRDGEKTAFLLQEYLTTLEQRFMSSPMTVEDVLRLGMALCDGLMQCQNAGIAHLDVQPRNVFLTDGGVWQLGDFGSALPVSELQGHQLLRGTLAYMAPEVYHRREYSHRSDLYSLAILLYSLLNEGFLPFGRECDKETAIHSRLNYGQFPRPHFADANIYDCLSGNWNSYPTMRPEGFSQFREILELAIARSSRETLRTVVNSSFIPEESIPVPKSKPSLLSKLFALAPEPDFPTVPPTIDPDRQAQMFRRENTEAMMDSTVPQVFESDSFAYSAALASPVPQVFESDGFACTCAIDCPTPQVFESDPFAFTCETFSPPAHSAPAPGYATAPCAPAQNYGACPPGYAPPPGYPPVQPFAGYAPGYYPSYSAPSPQMDQVRFSALAPRQVIPDEFFLAQIYMYQEEFRTVVDEAIAESDIPLQEKTSGFQKVKDGTRVKIVLTSPDVEIEDNEDSQVWCGGYLSFDYYIRLPEDYPRKQVLLKAAVYFDDVPATRLMLTVKVQQQQNAPIEVKRQDILSAFVSYASQDRNRVASLIQGMQKARPDLDIFFDVNTLRSGQDWKERLYHEIGSRDILFLCWSNNARQSPWVEREWRYALKLKGIDAIEPIPLEQPDVCPPPTELQSKHFNDMLLYIINR